MEEMKIILNEEKVITEAKAKSEYYIPRIIKQAQLEKGAQIERKIYELAITDEDSTINAYGINFYIHDYSNGSATIPCARQQMQARTLQLAYVGQC